MRNNFLSKAYGGVTVAQHKFNGLGLPRQWKVMTSTLLLLLTFSIGNVWAEDVTWEGDNTVFVDKKLSDEVTTITVTKDASNSSKKISCINSTSNKQYLSINGGGKYLKFAAPSGYTITNIQIVWMSGANNQALPILFGESISAVGTVESKDKAVTITKGGFKMTNQIATSAGTNCDSPDDIALPSGTKQVMIGRSGAYSIANYTIGEVEETVNFRLAGTSGTYFTTAVGAGSTPFIGRVTLTVVPEGYSITYHCNGATSGCPSDVASGATALPSTLATPEKTGFIFDKWYTDEGLTTPATAGATLTANANLYAGWISASSAYDVNIASMTNGSVVASPASQVEDGIVTLTVTPDDGYLLSSLSVIGDVSGDEVTVTANQFTMPAEDVTVNATFSLAPTYTVTLNPAGGTIVDATGWTLNAGNYEKEVAEGTVLTLPTFTKTDRAFKTWRKAGPADVASPVTVDGDLSLTAIWTATIEQVIYSWEGAEGGAIETGGTASSSTDGGSTFNDAQINVKQAETELYCLQINGNNSFGTNLVQITLAGEEKVKTGDKIKYLGFYSKNSTANARPKMRDANGSKASIFDDPNNLPNLYNGGEPAERTFTVPASINTNAVQITRSQTGSNTWIPKLQIIRDVQVEEGDLLTVTFDANGGSAIAPVVVASGQAVAKPADPTKAHNRFKEWQLAGSAYNFSTPVTANITLVANWTPLYTVTYAANGGSGTMTDANEYAAGDEVTLLTNTFEAPDASHIWDSWAVTDASDNPVAVSEGKFAMPNSAATVTAQWALISDFDVKFFQGYGDPDVQIGTTQSVSTGNYATAPAEDPERTGYRFLGWSYDATVEHIVNVSEYAITATTNFTAMWIQQFAVTFDGAGEVLVDNGATVASPNSPVMAGKVFQGWYNAEVKYDFSAAVTGNLALTSKWADADPNHYVYAYNDDFHFDGVVYKTPEGAVDGGSGTSNITMTTPYTLFAGAEGITSIVMTDGIYDSKTGAIQAVTALMKVNNNATSKLTVTIKSGYTATLKIKSSGYSAARTISVTDATPASGTTTGQAVTSGAMSVSGIGELSFALNSGSHDLTVTGGTLYIAELDIEATALPTHTVTYMPGEGTGAEFIIDDDATEVSDGSTMFTAPEGKIFNGWKDGDNNDVEVGTIVTGDMTLTAQWINHYAVTFNMNGHGDAIDPQDIKEGAKATKPADPVVMGFDFGGWFTESACETEFDFETPITAATPLFAKWTEFEGCALLYPALSGDALHVGDNVDLISGSTGGSIAIVGMKNETSITYNANGLSLSGGGADVISVTLNNDMTVGTKISVTLMAANTGSRGLNLLNATGGSVAGGTKLGWDDATLGEVGTFSYTVEASDGLEGTNIFRLQRNNSVYLQCVKVESCGAAITYHNLTSEVNIAGKGTVTLGATSVREGYTTTAEYSDIDPLYEFVNWTISGTGASIENATANPATITVGTEDAVVTLNLQLIPVKFTVEYYDGATLMGSEQVVVNEHPTASEIKTAKRGYIFEGWAMSSTATASDVVALNTITSDVAATINLYAVYSEFPCPTSGNLFTWVIDPDADEIVYNVVKNVETEMVTAADVMTITGGTVAVGTTSNSATFTIVDGAFKFRENGNNYTRIELNCALQVGDVISYTSDNSANRYMSIYKDDMSGTAVTTAVDGTRKYFVASTESPIYGAYVLYIKGSNSDCSFKTLSIDRLAPATGVSLENATIAIGNTVTPTMTLLPSNDAYYESIAWSIVGEGEGTIANIDAGTGAVTALAAGSVTVQVKLNNDESLKATCTVEVISSFDQVDVTESTVWDMNNVSANAIELTGDDKNARLLLANIDGVNNNSSFNSQALMFEGQHIGRTTNSVKHLAGRYVQFNVTKQGVVSVIFASNGDNQRTIRINDKKCTKTTNSGTYITYDVLVQPGSVEIVGMEGASDNQYIRISKITYTVKETPDYTRTEMLGSGVYGTICVDHNVPEGGVRGVTVYEIAGREPQYGKIAFDEVTEMAAGVPYVFIAHGNEMALYYGETTVANPVNGNGMYGTFKAQTLTELDGIYYFAKSALWSCVDLDSLSLPANRAYVKLSEIDYLGSSSPAPGRKRLLIGVNGAPAVATGLENVQGDNVQCTKVLINGQLFILRGEKMYDAKGQLVK